MLSWERRERGKEEREFYKSFTSFPNRFPRKTKEKKFAASSFHFHSLHFQISIIRLKLSQSHFSSRTNFPSTKNDRKLGCRIARWVAERVASNASSWGTSPAAPESGTWKSSSKDTAGSGTSSSNTATDSSSSMTTGNYGFNFMEMFYIFAKCVRFILKMFNT